MFIIWHLLILIVEDVLININKHQMVNLSMMALNQILILYTYKGKIYDKTS
jgi:hypothetical protein